MYVDVGVNNAVHHTDVMIMMIMMMMSMMMIKIIKISKAIYNGGYV